MLNIGDVVDGKYKILNKVGQGGMSIVYLAMNESANKPWAIKEVRKDGTKDFEVVKQGLMVETELLKKFNHPSLPSIIDVIDKNDNFLIVMDYIEGNPLSKALEEYGAQPQELVIKWGKQLCDVLGYLHARNIIYRDMKPSNVMLKPDGNIELIDFGTAREYKGNNLDDTICLGTIGYAAPEQFGGKGETDGRTDIYCLGATLYHLVTGKHPSVEPPYEIKPIREINPVLSEGLERIIYKCTRFNPLERYQNCEELMYDLEHCDENDKKYRRKQIFKIIAFITAIIFSVAGLMTGIICNNLAISKTQEKYENILEKAEKENYEEKYKSYLDAISTKPDDKRAYLELINKIYKKDEVFNREEINELETIMIKNTDKLEKNKNDYSTVCYNIGILYWYYCDEMMEDDNSRLDAVCNYFSKVTEKDDNKKIADIFYNMADFRRNIQNSVKESTDRGLYIQYWNNIKNLLDTIDEINVNSNVKLNSCKVVINALEGYAEDFRDDKVARTEIDEYIDKIKSIVENADINDGQGVDKIKEYITGRYEGLTRKLDMVYKEE